MNYILKDREPKAVLHYFEEISQIPRGSGNEKAIADYLVDFAEKRNLYVYRDELNNVFIRKNASKGFENSQPILLQGHTDMVCEKNMDKQHDFLKDPIELVVDGDYLRANSTTLGADDGVAVAYMLALLDSDNIAHPTLECLLTSGEEVGMIGAIGFDTNQITAKRMLNLDSDNEHEILCGSAGDARITIKKEFTKINAKGKCVTLKVWGLSGGHSGTEINLEKGNANKIMARILFAAEKIAKINIAEIFGGSKDNAIPRECVASIFVDDSKYAEVKLAMENMVKDIAAELEDSDKGLKLEITEDKKFDKMIDDKSSSEIISILKLLPNGVRANSMALKGLVVASNNIGVIVMNNDYLEIYSLSRSSVASLLFSVVDEIELISQTFGATPIRASQCPGWKYAVNSPLRDLCVKIYKELNASEPSVIAIHAGLECGLFKSKIPELDVVSNGPYCKDIHTPDERLDLKSLERVWQFLIKVLSQLK
ncbi:MAG: aminoacyl-histidine dipeptidase [Oscillospiraceae bacterium]